MLHFADLSRNFDRDNHFKRFWQWAQAAPKEWIGQGKFEKKWGGGGYLFFALIGARCPGDVAAGRKATEREREREQLLLRFMRALRKRDTAAKPLPKMEIAESFFMGKKLSVVLHRK